MTYKISIALVECWTKNYRSSCLIGLNPSEHVFARLIMSEHVQLYLAFLFGGQVNQWACLWQLVNFHIKSFFFKILRNPQSVSASKYKESMFWLRWRNTQNEGESSGFGWNPPQGKSLLPMLTLARHLSHFACFRCWYSFWILFVFTSAFNDIDYKCCIKAKHIVCALKSAGDTYYVSKIYASNRDSSQVYDIDAHSISRPCWLTWGKEITLKN